MKTTIEIELPLYPIEIVCGRRTNFNDAPEVQKEPCGTLSFTLEDFDGEFFESRFQGRRVAVRKDDIQKLLSLGVF